MSLLIQSNWWSGVGIDVGPLPEAAHLFQTLGVIYEQGLAAELLVRHGLEQKRPSADVAGVLRQAEAFYRRLDAHLHLIRVFSFWSALHFLNGEYEQGWAIYHEIQREFERQGNVRQLATSLHWESLAAARNSTFEHALATRQRSLELVREREAPSVLAWRLFELGDLYRIFDQPAQALSYYDQARASFEQMNVLLGLGFDHRARGDLALAEARSAEALAHYRQFLACALRDNHRWSIAQARGKLALALAHGGDADASRSELREAFRAARAWWEPGLILLILLAEPVCCLHEGRPEQAVELAGLLIHHPHTWNETKQQARAILATATHALPAEIVQAALERGQQLELEAVVQQLLGE